MLCATLNDDPESLEEVLDWGINNKEILKSIYQSNQTKCPLLIATVSNFTICIKLLYRFGFRIPLQYEDEARIQKMIKMRNTLSNDLHWYFSLLWRRGDGDSYRARKRIKDPRELDTVERFLQFKAHVSPIYVSVSFTEGSEEEQMEHCDPFRKMVAFAQYSRHLCNYYSEQRSEYKKIGKACQDYVEEILDQCENMEEVTTVLSYSQSMNSFGDGKDTNWRLAVLSGMKELVSHHYFQSFLWEKLTEDFFWDNYFLIWKILYIPLSWFLLLCYPFIILLDLVCRDGNILFLSPKDVSKVDQESRRATGKESRFFAFFRERMHRPIFRIITHISLEILFLLVMIISIFDPEDQNEGKDVSKADVITCVFVATFFIDDVFNICTQKLAFFSSYWNSYFFLSHFFFILGGGMKYFGMTYVDHDRRELLSGNHPSNVGSTLISFAAIITFTRCVRWLLLFRSFGPVVISMFKVLRDIFKLFALFAVTYVAFCIGTWSMLKNYTKRNGDEKYKLNDPQMSSVSGMIGALFWRLFDPGEPAMAEITRVVNGTESEDSDTSMEFSHLMSVGMWAIYQVIIAIILLNLLIALMNDTYSKIAKNADTEWKYNKTCYLMTFLTPKSAVPAPFNVFYYFARWISLLRNKCKWKQYNTINGSKRKKYVRLLERLIKSKMHMDYETSVQDDFNDLRLDVKNMIDSKHSEIMRKMDQILGKMETLEKRCQMNEAAKR